MVRAFSTTQRVFMYDSYVLTQSAREVQKRFQERFPGVDVPSRKTVHNLYNKFQETGSMQPKKPKKQRRVLTEEILHEIAHRLESSPKKSLRRLAQQVGISYGSVQMGTKLLRQGKGDFQEAAGEKENYASERQLAEPCDKLSARLFQLCNANGTFKVEEIVNFDQNDLVQEGVMLLDAWDILYLWIGKDSQQDKRNQAIQVTKQYLETECTNRDKDTLILVIKQGYEPPNFTGFFEVWDTSLWNNKSFEELRHEMEEENPALQIDSTLPVADPDFSSSPIST